MVDEVHSPNTGLKIREEVRIDPLMNLYYTRRHAYQSISPSKKKRVEPVVKRFVVTEKRRECLRPVKKLKY